LASFQPVVPLRRDVPHRRGLGRAGVDVSPPQPHVSSGSGRHPRRVWRSSSIRQRRVSRSASLRKRKRCGRRCRSFTRGQGVAENHRWCFPVEERRQCVATESDRPHRWIHHSRWDAGWPLIGDMSTYSSDW